MERDEFIKMLRTLHHSERGTIPYLTAFDILLAEFDRLKSEVDRLQSTPAAKLYAQQLADVGELRDRCRILQSWLDKISEPATNGMSDLPGLIGLWNRVQDYLDSQKPSEKLYWNHWSIKDYSERHDGKQVDCPICNPKPSEKPSHGTLSTRVCKHGCVVWSCPICNPTKTKCSFPECLGNCEGCKYLDTKPKCEHKNAGVE
jgi:hypothetical protein